MFKHKQQISEKKNHDKITYGRKAGVKVIWKKKLQRTRSDNRGFSLIELLLAIGILAVVALMLTQILTISARLYRKTHYTSVLQKDAQMISRRLETAIMNANSLECTADESNGTRHGLCLFLGTKEQKTAAESGTKMTVFQGPVVWFNQDTNCLYYKEDAYIESTAAVLDCAAAKSYLEGNGTQAKKDYLMSSNVAELQITIPENQGSGSTLAHTAVTYELKLRHISGAEYTIKNSAVPRNIRNTTAFAQ